MSLSLQKRIDGFVKLGALFRFPDEGLKQLAAQAHYHNGWFTPESVTKAFGSLGEMLSEDRLRHWAESYAVPDRPQPKTIGLVLAGNIPLVGFHDVLCVLISGHRAQVKMSSDDCVLLPYVLRRLTEIEPDFADLFWLTERLGSFDAVIATGSNNTSRYFEYYFGRVPNIIRKSRTSVAVITHETTADEIARLGHDIFDYYGLGCRNVSKLFLPKDFVIDHLFEPIEPFKSVLHHHKYNNNYDYQKSILLVNRVPHFDNGFLLLKEDENLVSPLASLYYERYNDLDEVEKNISKNSTEIQCVVSGAALKVALPLVDLGSTQCPGPGDYADNVDTMAFLTSLES